MLQPTGDRPRIAVLCGYMPFFDEVMPEGYRAEKARWGEAVSMIAAGGTGEDRKYDVLYTGLITDFESGHRAGRLLNQFQPDVILLAPTMAAPAGYTWTAIRDFQGTPLVIWNAHELETIPSTYDMPDLCRHSANVGTLMITNVLLRHGWQPALVTGRFHDAAVREQLRRTLRAAATAGRLRRSRFGVLGRPLDGYLNVVTDPGALQAKLGVSLVDVAVEELTDAYLSLPEAEVAELAAHLENQYRVDPPNDQDQYFRSVRLAGALAQLVRHHRLDGGTFNCRFEYSCQNPAIGLIGCLANTYLTTAGFPFTCTGDTITAIAMYLGKQLGGDTLYCECDAIDYERDLMLCANTGEGDFCQACSTSRCTVIATGAASGRKAQGCSVLYPAQPGPATLIGFTPHAAAKGGYNLIAAPGEIIGTPDLAIRVPTLWFRFRNGPTAQAFDRWCLAGAAHHGGISSGDWSEEIRLIGSFLGIEATVV
jgi:L-arabinose isomerase